MSLNLRYQRAKEAGDEAQRSALHQLLIDRDEGRLIECLDDGFVKLVDKMGDDAAIVQAARTSYGEGTTTPSSDETLIRYLMRHRHTTPFEMVECKFLIRIPMDAWRQMIRHRTASVNEYSTRYSEAIDSRQCTPPSEWRSQSKNNKQGSGTFLTESGRWPADFAPDLGPSALTNNPDPHIGEYLTARERQLHELQEQVYQERLRAGVAREQARKDLPLSTYTEAYWKCDLHNIFHYLGLRMDGHAQLEIRTFANAMFKLAEPLFPMACQAFRDYRLEGMFLSGPEIKMIRSRLLNHTVAVHWTKREESELAEKLERLGIAQ